MRIGPQLECQGCGLPILLAFAEPDGARRSLTCPACGHAHLWVVSDVRGEVARDSQPRLGSSVE